MTLALPAKRLGTDPVPAFALFARYPELGCVKSRLAAAIGPAAALRVYRVLLQRSIQTLSRISPRACCSLCHTPRNAADYFQQVAKENGLSAPFAQDDEATDLGARMLAAWQHMAGLGHSPIFLAGSDCPDMSSTHLQLAIDAMHQGSDLVLGPAHDGGYYLIGVRHPRPELLEGIAWSTDRVLAQTLQRAETGGLRTTLLPRLRDIDRLEDLVASPELMQAAGFSSSLGIPDEPVQPAVRLS
jgi:uncharacterized protein